MRDHLTLFINGKLTHVSGEDAFLTLSDFLRRRQGLTGTKVVCAEGDCGSCSVMIGRVRDGAMQYASVTSCIAGMFQLDATHVVTVEGLKDAGELNPIQSAMVKCGGSQCGFCTPGFVVAMYDTITSNKTCDAETMRRGLVGNLCRCTGYDAILQAAAETDATSVKPMETLYPSATVLAQLLPASRHEVLIEAAPRKFYKPTTLEQAVRFRTDNPSAAIIAGGTDLGVLINKRVLTPVVILNTSSVIDFDTVKVADGMLSLGGGASLTALEHAALRHIPELGKFLAWFGSPLIKNGGTVAGNLATGSPIGDTIPALIVLDASLDLAGPKGIRRVAMGDFYTGYRKSVLAPEELIAAVHIPLPKAGEVIRIYKVSRRLDLDISTFSAAIKAHLAAGVVTDIRIAFGGVGPMVMRMIKTEASLRGQPATLETFERAGAIAGEEVTPISDVRGSEVYRRTLAKNILSKFWHDAIGGHGGYSGGANPTAPQNGSTIVGEAPVARFASGVTTSPGGNG